MAKSRKEVTMHLLVFWPVLVLPQSFQGTDMGPSSGIWFPKFWRGRGLITTMNLLAKEEPNEHHEANSGCSTGEVCYVTATSFRSRDAREV